MSALWRNIKREPVRWLSGFQIAWVAIIGGFIVFDKWDPTPDQLQWTLAIPVVLAGVFGITVVRNAVTPNAKLPQQVEDAAEDDRLIRVVRDAGFLMIPGWRREWFPRPRRDRDWGLTLIETILLIVVVVLAIFGLLYLLGR